MEKYNYHKEMYNDIINYIKDNYDIAEIKENPEEMCEQIQDDLWIVDEITGNGGSYYADEEACSRMVGDNLYLLIKIKEEYFGAYALDNAFSYNHKNDIGRYLDCTIRCFLLTEIVQEVIDELIKE